MTDIENPIDRAIQIQDRIDGLQRIIAFDPGALGVKKRLKEQINLLRWEQVNLIHDAFPEE